MHGAGFTGSGEVYLASVVEVEATREGNPFGIALAASLEIGQCGIEYCLFFADLPLTRWASAGDQHSRSLGAEHGRNSPTAWFRISRVAHFDGGWHNLVRDQLALAIKKDTNWTAACSAMAARSDEFVRACRKYIEDA